MVFPGETSPSQNRGVKEEEFASRERFLTEFGGFVEVLVGADVVLSGDSGKDFSVFVSDMRSRLERIEQTFGPEETELFETFWDLFYLKHELPHFPPTLYKLLKGEGLSGQTIIEVSGPIASCKSTLATALMKEIDAQGTAEDFGSEGNPFLDLAYADPGLMFRAQLKFLSASIIAGLDTRLQTGRWVRDMSVWADSFIYEEWRRRSDIINPEEHQIYRQLFRLFADPKKPLIAKPDLLIMIRPNSLERLWQGFQTRLKAESDKRKMERDLTRDDLEVACAVAQDAVQILRKEYGLNILELKVDPVAFYKDGDLRYEVIYTIQDRLGLLGEMIQPPLEEVVSKIKEFLAWKHGRLFYLCSPSMFTRKTTTLVELHRQIGEKILIFQPAKSRRYGEGDAVITLDHARAPLEYARAPGITIESNKLEDLLAYVKAKTNPEETPVLAIDELMLFENSDVEAVNVIRELREMGFNVIVTGLALNFKGEAFGFMDVFAYWAQHDPEASMIVASTRCRYCHKRAAVTRLIKSQEGNLAQYGDPAVFVGYKDFCPVCGEGEHLSCEGRPKPFEGFKANLMPRKKRDYDQILLEGGSESR